MQFFCMYGIRSFVKLYPHIFFYLYLFLYTKGSKKGIEAIYRQNIVLVIFILDTCVKISYFENIYPSGGDNMHRLFFTEPFMAT